MTNKFQNAEQVQAKKTGRIGDDIDKKNCTIISAFFDFVSLYLYC